MTQNRIVYKNEPLIITVYFLSRLRILNGFVSTINKQHGKHNRLNRKNKKESVETVLLNPLPAQILINDPRVLQNSPFLPSHHNENSDIFFCRRITLKHNWNLSWKKETLEESAMQG